MANPLQTDAEFEQLVAQLQEAFDGKQLLDHADDPEVARIIEERWPPLFEPEEEPVVQRALPAGPLPWFEP